MSICYEDSQRQIQALARRVLRRAHAAGARTVLLEDVVGELTLAWCVARDKFDASLGVPFGAYLHKGMLDHANRWVARQINEGHVASLDVSRTEAEDDDGLYGMVSSDEASPEEVAAAASRRRLVEKNLTGNTALFVQLLENGCAELEAALTAARERSDFAKSRGVSPSPVPRSITAGMVFDLMGLSRTDRHEVLTDLNYWTAR